MTIVAVNIFKEFRACIGHSFLGEIKTSKRKYLLQKLYMVTKILEDETVIIYTHVLRCTHVKKLDLCTEFFVAGVVQYLDL